MAFSYEKYLESELGEPKKAPPTWTIAGVRKENGLSFWVFQKGRWFQAEKEGGQKTGNLSKKEIEKLFPDVKWF